MQLLLFKMNGRLDSYISVSVPNGFHETVSSDLSVSNYESLIDLSPSRCRASSNPSAQDVVREGQISRMVYDSPTSLLTNGVLYRNSIEAAHLPAHYWSGKQSTQVLLFCITGIRYYFIEEICLENICVLVQFQGHKVKVTQHKTAVRRIVLHLDTV